MITCDLSRAALVALMALPGLHLWIVIGLLVVMQLIGAPFKAARAAILPEVLLADRFEVGSGVLFTSLQVACCAGTPLAPRWSPG